MTAAVRSLRLSPLTRKSLVGFAVAVTCIAANYLEPACAALVTLIALGCLWEYAGLIERKGVKIERTIAFAAVLAYMILTYVGLIRRYESVLLGATLIAALAGATFWRKGDYIARSGYTLLGVLYIGKLSSYFITIRDIPGLGMALILWAMFIIAFTDIFAMVVGMSIGRTPLSSLSPKKTVEGAIGGFVAACAIGVAFTFTPALPFAWWQGAIVAAITSIAAQAGDLVESALKRDARVKDAGNALLGHGGALDRFDSFLFGGIAFYFALWLIGFTAPGLHALMHGARAL